MQFLTSLGSVAIVLSSVVTAVPFTLEKRNGVGSVVTDAIALTWYQPDFTVGNAGRNPPNAYTCYSGSVGNFPKFKTWTNFNHMWSNAVQYAFTAAQPTSDNDKPAEIQSLYNSIVAVSQQSKVDARVILATVLLESTGLVRRAGGACTESFGGVPNCGLMQSYNGTKWNPNQSLRSIRQMIVDGTQGTEYGPGLVQLFNDAPDTPHQSGGNPYKVFREYNSGSLNKKNLSDGKGAGPAYVSNMANYLQGWNGYGADPNTFCNFGAQTAPPATTS